MGTFYFIIDKTGLGERYIKKLMKNKTGVYIDNPTPPSTCIRQVLKNLNIEIKGLNIYDMAEELKSLNYTFYINHAEKLTDSFAIFIQAMLDKNDVYVCCTTLPTGKIIPTFFKHGKEIKLTSRKNRIIEYISKKYKISSDVARHIYTLACGDINGAEELARRLSEGEPLHSLRYDGATYISIIPILLGFGFIFIMLRFIALGLNDEDTYIFAGCMGAMFFLFRFIYYQYFRKII
ncbi:hypothetical protein Thena_0416 [Thermodesulfobium narugense DSM 14796]|uniref:Uncharacterized protein n=1 Tax=Thermodesulfobium narugense DSM 14796 TaxID=747365 RepID=M1E7M2_9BACT|nr:hypothetical protein [Thermodesulfobium narugense]AEE14059.1 hypothetical protein Thena_0416 [Thermodesulfobium narugense DSM 14796]